MEATSLKEVERWMTYYYQDPQPEAVPQAVRTLSREGALSDPNAIEQIIYFLGFLFRAHPDRLEEWVTPLANELPATEMEALITAVWLSDTDRARSYLDELATSRPEVRAFVREIVATPTPDIERTPIDNPETLDVLWAAFMATGEEKYVVRIISALAKEEHQDEALHRLVRETAKWSLGSNAKRHARVLSICQSQLSQQPPEAAAILQEIVDAGGE